VSKIAHFSLVALGAVPTNGRVKAWWFLNQGTFDGLMGSLPTLIEENLVMKKAMLLASAALAVGFLLSGPALAGSSTSDRPIVVAEEGGVSINLGGRDHDRDARRHHHPSIVVGGHHHRDHHPGGDHDHNR